MGVSVSSTRTRKGALPPRDRCVGRAGEGCGGAAQGWLGNVCLVTTPALLLGVCCKQFFFYCTLLADPSSCPLLLLPPPPPLLADLCLLPSLTSPAGAWSCHEPCGAPPRRRQPPAHRSLVHGGEVVPARKEGRSHCRPPHGSPARNPDPQEGRISGAAACFLAWWWHRRCRVALLRASSGWLACSGCRFVVLAPEGDKASPSCLFALFVRTRIL